MFLFCQEHQPINYFLITHPCILLGEHRSWAGTFAKIVVSILGYLNPRVRLVEDELPYALPGGVEK
jgi:hypothetical protein